MQERSEQVQSQVLDLVDPAWEKGRIALAWLDKLSFRYLLSQSPEAILRHYGMENDLNSRPLVLNTRQSEGEMWQITVATRDRPGLFAIITGVLWAGGLNILWPDMFTRQSGIALDVIIVERMPDPLHPCELWEKVETDLIEALRDRTYLSALLSMEPLVAWRIDIPAGKHVIEMLNKECALSPFWGIGGCTAFEKSLHSVEFTAAPGRAYRPIVDEKCGQQWFWIVDSGQIDPAGAQRIFLEPFIENAPAVAGVKPPEGRCPARATDSR